MLSVAADARGTAPAAGDERSRAFRRVVQLWPVEPHAKAQQAPLRPSIWDVVTKDARRLAQKLRVELPDGIAQYRSKADPQ